MHLEQITQYVSAEYAILAAVLYCLGLALKSIRKFPNQFIPLALTGCGIVLACLSVVSRYGEYANWAAALFEGVVQGILCTGLAVYLNEVISHSARNNCECKKDRDKKD